MLKKIKLFRGNFGKFSSSVSSIYPDNSLLSFEEYDHLPPQTSLLSPPHLLYKRDKKKGIEKWSQQKISQNFQKQSPLLKREEGKATKGRNQRNKGRIDIMDNSANSILRQNNCITPPTIQNAVRLEMIEVRKKKNFFLILGISIKYTKKNFFLI